MHLLAYDKKAGYILFQEPYIRFYDNIPRILPEKCDAEINAAAWEIPVVFKKLQEWGNVPWAEMYRTFNMGVGMVLVVAPEEADAVRSHLTSVGEPFYE